MERFRPRSHAIRQQSVLSDDAGVSLVELMMAIMIFAIAMAGITAGFVSVGQKTRLNKDRVAAANLASRELEIARNVFNASSTGPITIAADLDVTNGYPLPGGTAGSPLVVDSVPYTVFRRAEWLPAGTGQSPCDGGSGVTYPTLAVNVKVTWPYMGQVKPIESNTLLTPPKGVLASSTSFVAVKVVGSNGLGKEDVPVTVSGTGGTYTATTAEDGCATVAVATTGTYTASLNSSGWVDFYGASNPSKSVTASASSISRLTFNYDRAGSLELNLTTAAGYALPTGLRSVTLGNTGLQPSGTQIKDIGTGGNATITTLWPFSDGYTLWAGSCGQSDPAAAGGSRASAVVVPSAGGASTATQLAPVRVNVTTSTGSAIAAATVTATPLSTTTCVATENPLTLGVTNSSGQLQTSLPAGSWTLKVTGKTAVGAWPNTPVLLPGSAAVTVGVSAA
ncbi:MAG: prepilin-type N-terminal cleavage/methylation domain-containing protein [Actinomycetes bacterium]